MKISGYSKIVDTFLIMRIRAMKYSDDCDVEGMSMGEVVAGDLTHRDGIVQRTVYVRMVWFMDCCWMGLLRKRMMCKEHVTNVTI